MQAPHRSRPCSSAAEYPQDERLDVHYLRHRGLGYFAASGGEVVLNPPSGAPKGFYYGAAGVGLSIGLKKIPKIGKILDARSLSERGTGVVAPKSFWNHGVVYGVDGVSGDEQSVQDFRACRRQRAYRAPSATCGRSPARLEEWP